MGVERYVAVVGPSSATPEEEWLAEEVGAGLAAAGTVVVTGGLGGVMEAACRGAKSRLGRTIGVLPGTDRTAANGWVDLALSTGMGELRNAIVVRAADAVIAIGRSHGTLSEVALALHDDKLVVGLGTWDIEGMVQAADPSDAVTRVLRHGS